VGARGLTPGDDPAALLRAAMAAHQSGRWQQADDAYAGVLRALPDHLQALRLRGILKRELGDLAGSAALLRRAAELAPASADALAELALTHLAAGDLELAETALRRSLGRERSPKALANLGAVLQYRGHLAEADGLYRDYLAADPGDVEVRCNLVSLLLDAGRGDAALAECDAAGAACPGEPAVEAARGATLLALGRPTEALGPLRRALDRAPGDDLAAVNLAVALAELDDVAAARQVLEAAVARNPDNARATADLMSLRAGAGDALAAVALGRAFLARHPGERLVVAALGYALWDAGDDAAAGRLLGFGDGNAALVQVFDAGSLPAPDPRPGRDAIVRRLAGDPSLVRSPVSKSTRDGGQTGELYLHRERELAVLDGCFRAAVQAYVERVVAAGFGEDPVMAGASTAFSLRAWGTLLPAGGRQLPHQHPLGWLSAVYYVAVPPGMGAGGDDPEAGWLEFGPPPARYRFRRPPPVSRIEPAEGRLVMFPSYLYHGTRPFAGPGERISVAVDVMPRR
jgi:tetratricopeptide (TPR) repeat protein